jgi:hypothetical protein
MANGLEPKRRTVQHGQHVGTSGGLHKIWDARARPKVQLGAPSGLGLLSRPFCSSVCLYLTQHAHRRGMSFEGQGLILLPTITSLLSHTYYAVVPSN